MPCFGADSELLGLIVFFQQLDVEKLKVHYTFQFWESTRILIRVLNGLYKNRRALFCCAFCSD